MLAVSNRIGRHKINSHLALIPRIFKLYPQLLLSRFYTVRAKKHSVIYLTPLIPLSFKGEGEGYFLKGLRPFKLSVIICAQEAIPLKTNPVL